MSDIPSDEKKYKIKVHDSIEIKLKRYSNEQLSKLLGMIDSMDLIKMNEFAGVVEKKNSVNPDETRFKHIKQAEHAHMIQQKELHMLYERIITLEHKIQNIATDDKIVETKKQKILNQMSNLLKRSIHRYNILNHADILEEVIDDDKHDHTHCHCDHSKEENETEKDETEDKLE